MTVLARTFRYFSAFPVTNRGPHAAYFANSYHHTDQPHETWIDVILGTWGTNDLSDHVTFGCRVGPVEGSPQPAATLVQACLDGSARPVHGALLSREEALAHPRLPEFWAAVDVVLANDPTVNAHLYGRARPRTRRRPPGRRGRTARG